MKLGSYKHSEHYMDRSLGKVVQKVEMETFTRLITENPDELDPTKLPERDPEFVNRLAATHASGNGGNGAHE